MGKEHPLQSNMIRRGVGWGEEDYICKKEMGGFVAGIYMGVESIQYWGD